MTSQELQGEPVVVCPKCGCVMEEYRAREKGHCYYCGTPLKDVPTTQGEPPC